MPLYYSRRVRYILGTGCLFFVTFILLRAIFYFGFSEVNRAVVVDSNTLLTALSIGIRFDLRLALLITMPLFVLACIPSFNLTSNAMLRKAAMAYVFIVTPIVGLLYIFDFGHYAYLGNRLNATALGLLADFMISMQMVWESYHVVWITIGWLICVGVISRIFYNISQRTIETAGKPHARWQVGIGMTVLFIFMFALMFGRISLVPLRWNHAYFSGQSAVSELGLNPVLYFCSTLSNREPTFSIDLVKQHYAQVADYLGVTERDAEQLNYDRQLPASDHAVVAPGQRKPNVIFIMLESLGASRVGIYGNPLKPTPNLDAMAQNGVWAPEFYVPNSGTARTVFGSITGIADVAHATTASRNPLITDQRVVMNSFEDFDKYYFLGGSAGWANMSGFIKDSIPDIKLVEEDYYTEPVVDVWGISDYSLFKEFDQFIAKRKADGHGDKPFVAIIQTAANHKPFTIPKERHGFEPSTLSDEELAKGSYQSLEQFNSVRLLDHNIGKFLEMAKNSGYFDDTIFILYGDHNDHNIRAPHMALFHEKVLLDLDGLHVPFIIYSPKHLPPQQLKGMYSLVDVWPTAAGLVGIPYTNTTMGRDVFAPAPEGERAVYVNTNMGKDMDQLAIGMITENFALRMYTDYSRPTLHKLMSEHPEQDVKELYPDVFARLNNLTIGYYETTMFQFYHNRKREADERKKMVALNLGK